MTDGFRHDLHLHTGLSVCSPPDTRPADYAALCAQEGLRVLGFSNHAYLPAVLEKRGHPGVTTAAYLSSLRPQLEEAASYGVRLLLGAEVEIFPRTGPSLPPEDAAGFDYVLLAASHIFNQAWAYEGFDLSDADKVRRVLVDRFLAACRLRYPCPVGICHPLYPICCPWEQEVVDGLSDACLNECFSAAREAGFSIEIHVCLTRPGTARNEEGLSPSYLRLLAAAKACGCTFHFGSDAHTPGAFAGHHAPLWRAAELCGITGEDLWPVAAG